MSKTTKKLTPQVQTLLSHLKTHGSITQAEASTVYRMRALPRRISDLKEAGHIIRRELKVDATGQRYARYFYEGFKKPEQKQLDIPAPPAKPKVGDRVRVVSVKHGEASTSLHDPQGRYYRVGMEGMVVAQTRTDCVRVRFKGYGVPLEEPQVGIEDLEVLA